MDSADLVAAKLRPPVSLAPLLPRPRIDALLDKAAAGTSVVLLTGPAGSGKTAALSSWSTGGWITIDAQDNDPVLFWRYLAQAVGAAGNGPIGSDAFVAALAAAVPAGTVLVLDEFEHLVAPGIHRQLDLLLSIAGDRLTLVIASRVRPGLRLDRLQLAGRLTILSWHDLRFSAEESALFGRRVLDSEGWPGSVVLESVGEFLVEHVWERLAPDHREFLLDCAVPARFDVPLMNAVRGRSDSAELLDRLRRNEVFLIADDGGGRWYRLQRSFREALLHRLETTDPDRLTTVRRAAARWHAVSGDREEAIGLALASGDHPLAVRLLDEQLDGLYRAGRLVSLDQWLGALPDSALAGSGLGRRALNLWCELGRFGERDRWIRETTDSPAPDEVWRLCLPRERGDLAQALRQGRRTLSKSSSTPQTATQARISLSRTLLLAGQPDEALKLTAEIPSLWKDAVPPPVQVAMHGIRTLASHQQSSEGMRAAAESPPEAAQAGAELPLEVVRAGAELVREGLRGCQVRPSARMMPEAMVVLALAADHPGAELAELIDGSGYGSDLTMGAFVNLLLAQYLGAGPEGQARLAAADALLTQCPSALGLVDFRNRVAGEVGEPASAPAVDVGLLSERELSVLQYLRSELTLREIAEDLFLSVNTVKTHAGSVYRKLGLSGRHELG